MRLPIAAALFLAVTALPRPADALGEAVNGFPNWRERVVHQWINRARSDPQFEMSACGSNCAEKACYTPKAPLPWSLELNRAARFHSDEMLRQGYFAHDSRCTVPPGISSLYPASCNGAASCACSGSGSTAWWQRIQYFGASAAGEIIASPSDPNHAFYLWLYEPSSTTACTFTSANGHRWLILEATGSVGAGVSGPTVGDFGNGGTPAQIPSGSHYPQQGSSVELWANWYDAAGPSDATVNIAGSCAPMSLGRGSAANGAYTATVTGVGSGCYRYYFSFRNAAGNLVTYPTTGSLAIGSGSGCPDWSSERPATCNPPPTATPTPTVSPTATLSVTPTATPSNTPTVSPTSTSSPTPTATRFATLSGRIVDSHGIGIDAIRVEVRHANGTFSGITQTDGRFAVDAPFGSVAVAPVTDAPGSDGIDGTDGAALLGIAAGTVLPTARSTAVGDVSGNGTVSAYDAALVLRYGLGFPESFPTAVRCGWATVYLPIGAASGAALAPEPAECERGARTVVVSGAVAGIDFEAVQLGDAAGP